jgi:hemolysin III
MLPRSHLPPATTTTDRQHTPRERVVDGCVHWSGIVAGSAAALLLCRLAVENEPARGLVAILVYVVGLLAMLFCSAAYNMTPPRAPYREALRRLDHAAIFLMIAGTYAPFTLGRLATGWSIAMTAAVWGIAVFGAICKLAFPERRERMSLALYLLLGWLGLPALAPALLVLDNATVLALTIGGIFYTVGTIFHLWHRLPFQNAIWHGFVLLGAAAHYAAVLHLVAAGAV